MDHDAALRLIEDVTAAFDRHDLDAIMALFADDAVFESPRGPDPWGRRFVGREEVREGFAGRFSGIPDVRYTGDDHFVDGDRGASEWTLVRNDDERRADRGPRLRPLDIPRRQDREEGLVLEDQDDGLALRPDPKRDPDAPRIHRRLAASDD